MHYQCFDCWNVWVYCNLCRYVLIKTPVPQYAPWFYTFASTVNVRSSTLWTMSFAFRRRSCPNLLYEHEFLGLLDRVWSFSHIEKHVLQCKVLMLDVASMTQFWIVRNHLYFPFCLFNLHFKDLRFFSTKKTTKTSAFHRTASTHLWQSLPCFDLKIPPSSPWIFVQPLKVMMKIKKLIFGGKQTLKCHNYRTSISFLMCI